MSDSAPADLLNSARDRFEASVKWCLLGTVGVALFHIVILAEVASLQRQLAESRDQQARFAAARELSDRLSAELTRLKAPLERPKELLGRLRGLLIEDFQGLTSAIHPYLEHLHHELTGGAPVRSDVGVQSGLPERAKLSPELEKALKSSKTWEEVREALYPHVLSRIIEPRFQAANKDWETSQVPEALARIRAATELANRLAESFPEGKELCAGILGALSETEKQLKSLRFVPPENADWWKSVDGKSAALNGLAAHFADRLIGGKQAESGLEELVKSLSAVSAREEKLSQSLEKSMEQFEAEFTALEANLTELAKPFKFLAMDLATLVGRFPLVLGVILSAVVLWPSWMKRRVELIARLLDDPKADDFAVKLARLELSEHTKAVRWAGGTVVAAGGVVWIALACVTSLYAQVLPAGRSVLYGGLGLGVYVLSLAYRRALLPQPPAAPRPATK